MADQTYEGVRDRLINTTITEKIRIFLICQLPPGSPTQDIERMNLWAAMGRVWEECLIERTWGYQELVKAIICDGLNPDEAVAAVIQEQAEILQQLSGEFFDKKDDNAQGKLIEELEKARKQRDEMHELYFISRHNFEKLLSAGIEERGGKFFVFIDGNEQSFETHEQAVKAIYVAAQLQE